MNKTLKSIYINRKLKQRKPTEILDTNFKFFLLPVVVAIAAAVAVFLLILNLF